MIREFEDTLPMPDCGSCEFYYNIGKQLHVKGKHIQFLVGSNPYLLDRNYGDIHDVIIDGKPLFENTLEDN